MKVNLYEKKELNLREYYTFGLSLLQLMAVLGTIGLVTIWLYEYFK